MFRYICLVQIGYIDISAWFKQVILQYILFGLVCMFNQTPYFMLQYQSHILIFSQLIVVLWVFEIVYYRISIGEKYFCGILKFSRIFFRFAISGEIGRGKGKKEGGEGEQEGFSEWGGGILETVLNVYRPIINGRIHLVKLTETLFSRQNNLGFNCFVILCLSIYFVIYFQHLSLLYLQF